MAKRSLTASSTGIKKAKQQFNLKGWTQEFLANEIGIKTRQPIWRFFAGLPIERFTFFEICSILDLDWREIAESPTADVADRDDQEAQTTATAISISLESLVQTVRLQRHGKVHHQCGVLQLLDINRPVAIDHIFTDVNILEQIASQQWLETSALGSLTPADVDRFCLGKIEASQVPGMEAVEKYKKLRVLGKPGSGKSTFLKHLAFQCNSGNFAAQRVPIFVTLRDFAESFDRNEQADLLRFIHQEFITSDLSSLSDIKRLLHEGRALLLIDGMDEVWHEKEHTVINEIRRFSEKYHENQIVTSCRTASHKLSLKGFTDVEIAPFTEAQIVAFTRKWFVEFSDVNQSDGLQDASDFVAKLERPENWRFRQLVTTPLFLHLACSIFHRQEQFPIRQSDFYKKGMDLLLGKWDEVRGIERDEVYKGLLLPQKLKLLSYIALATFEKGQFFFEENVIEQHIGDYLQNSSSANDDEEAVQVASESILRAIESQHGVLAERAHGIFSFSYLALHEYFTARKIVAGYNLRSLEHSLSQLVNHVTDPHWREIFLLTTTMLRSADGLIQLMKQQIDALVSKDPYLQKYLTWASLKSQDTSTAAKPATGRAFYLALTQLPHLTSHWALACTLDQGIFLDAILDDLLNKSENKGNESFAHVHACGEALRNILNVVLDLGFRKSLQKLSDQLPDDNHTKASFERWCHSSYQNWVIELQQTISIHRGISQEWQFTPEQQTMLQSYYDANQLLIDCLNSNCTLTKSIREEVEATLLLPQKELEEREWE